MHGCICRSSLCMCACRPYSIQSPEATWRHAHAGGLASLHSVRSAKEAESRRTTLSQRSRRTTRSCLCRSRSSSHPSCRAGEAFSGPLQGEKARGEVGIKKQQNRSSHYQQDIDRCERLQRLTLLLEGEKAGPDATDVLGSSNELAPVLTKQIQQDWVLPKVLPNFANLAHPLLSSTFLLQLLLQNV